MKLSRVPPVTLQIEAELTFNNSGYLINHQYSNKQSNKLGSVQKNT